jgi:hypothetical protein
MNLNVKIIQTNLSLIVKFCHRGLGGKGLIMAMTRLLSTWQQCLARPRKKFYRPTNNGRALTT